MSALENTLSVAYVDNIQSRMLTGALIQPTRSSCSLDVVDGIGLQSIYGYLTTNNDISMCIYMLSLVTLKIYLYITVKIAAPINDNW